MTSGMPSAASVMPAMMSGPRRDLSKGSRPCNIGRRHCGLLDSCLFPLTVARALLLLLRWPGMRRLTPRGSRLCASLNPAGLLLQQFVSRSCEFLQFGFVDFWIWSRRRVKEANPLLCDIGFLLPISEGSNPILAVTMIICVLVCHRRWPVIIRHATTCNFPLDGFLFFEVGPDVIIGVALPRSVVQTHAPHAQAIHEFVAPQLQIGSG